MKRHIYLNTKMMRLGLCMLFLSVLSFFVVAPAQVLAEPKCAILAQGSVACPVAADGKSSLGTGSDNCYYLDPGNPRAGDANYPGWQKSSCDADIYKKAASVATNPRYKPDPALACKSGTCGFMDKVNQFINALSALVAIVVVLSIVVGAIQYGSSADDPQKVNAAKSRISSAIVALIAYFLLYALLQWLVPGGLLNEL